MHTNIKYDERGIYGIISIFTFETKTKPYVKSFSS